MRPFIVALLALVLPAAPVQDDEDRVTLKDGTEQLGRVSELDVNGFLVVTRGDRSVRTPIEEVLRIAPAAPSREPEAPTGQRVLLEHGAVVTGTIVSLADRRCHLETVHGNLSIPVSAIVRICWTTAPPPPVEKGEEAKDAVIPLKGPVERGSVVAITRDEVTLAGKDSETRKIAISGLQQVVFARGEAATAPARGGHFARVSLRHGDRYAGVLKSVRPGAIELFSHQLGRLVIGRAWVQSIQFVGLPRVISGNLLICDQNGVREYDPSTGAALWSYQKDGYPISARKLENGNVLIACYNANQVIEVRPRKDGGDIVWTSPPVTNPYDAELLPNGRVLVAAHGENAVVEIDVKTRERKWSCNKIMQPLYAQRLPAGTTLICSTVGAFEVDEKSVERWKAAPPAFQPWRATRLENGNTLIVESALGRVLEITSDKDKTVLRKFDGLTHPVAALRLEDGRTLVLESETGRVLQVDVNAPPKVILPGLNYPVSFSTY